MCFSVVNKTGGRYYFGPRPQDAALSLYGRGQTGGPLRGRRVVWEDKAENCHGQAHTDTEAGVRGMTGSMKTTPR